MKFLILGNASSIIYKEVFPLIKDNKIWWGISPRGMNFETPEGGTINVNACWFTNLPHPKRTEKLTLYKKYNPEEYPHYDNYDAIEVSKTKNIPVDWDGQMGVPVTFLDKYNPEQFEILGRCRDMELTSEPRGNVSVNGKVLYMRLIIKRKQL